MLNKKYNFTKLSVTNVLVCASGASKYVRTITIRLHCVCMCLCMCVYTCPQNTNDQQPSVSLQRIRGWHEKCKPFQRWWNDQEGRLTHEHTHDRGSEENKLSVCVCMLWLHCHCWWRCMRTIENDYQHGLLPSLVDLCVCECVFCMKNWNYKSDRTIVPLERQTEIASTVLGDYFSISNRQCPTYHY